MSTIIYARISSPNQAEYNGQHFSIENQISRCTEYCQTNLFNITDVVTEVVSARDINKQNGLINIYNTKSNNLLLHHKFEKYYHKLLYPCCQMFLLED